jgi:hypothetical protein
MTDFDWLDSKRFALCFDRELVRLMDDFGMRLKPSERLLSGRKCKGCSSLRFCVLSMVISVN